MSLLVTENLSIGYDFSIIEKINISAEKGEVIALLGENGAGKSTLLKTICGILKSIDGKINLKNIDISKIRPIQLAKITGFSNISSTFTQNLTVEDFVSLGRIPYTGISGKLSKIDNEYIDIAIRNTDLEQIRHKKMSKISDGQKQRVAIARLLSQNTELMIFDEPTAFLDIKNKLKISELFAQIARKKEKTIIYSTHDFKNAILFADKIWLIFNNKIFQQYPEDLIINGIFKDFFANSNIIFDNFTADFDVNYNVSKTVGIENKTNDKIIFIWTVNALNKNGYDIGEKSEVKVEILERKWRIIFGNKSYTVNSIENLIKILKNVEKSNF